MPLRPKTHGQLMRAAHPELCRGNSADRGYDRQWRNARARFIRKNPLCLYCQRQKKLAAATLIDHNPPHCGDMTLFWNRATWTPCCRECHDHVTQVYDGGGGRSVRLRDGVYVAPESGETSELCPFTGGGTNIPRGVFHA